MLVGNKTDLRTDEATIHELAKMGQEPIKVEDGHAMAKKISAYAYLECSAKLNMGVREVLEKATQDLVLKEKTRKRWSFQWT